VQVVAAEVVRCRLRLVRPFRTAHGTELQREVVLVRLTTDGSEGWGECSALTTPGYTGEHAAGAFAVLRDELVPRLLAAGDAGETAALLDAPPMARAALETALLDARLRAAGRSLAAHLGATRDRVPAGAVIGLHDDVDALVATVAEAVAAGYRHVKLKLVPGHDVEPLRAVRAAFPALALQADANGAYTPDDLDVLVALDGLALECLEQPLAPDDLAGHAALARRIGTPVCLDESIGSADDVGRAVDVGACRVVSVKAPRVGGLREAMRVHDACVEAGVDAFVGGMLETGVGRAAAVALAALPGFTVAGDLGASDRYYARDLTEPFVLDDGALRVPDGPGLGVTVDEDALAGCTVEAVHVTR
jgi:O-succinylbenzoate synthase